MNFGVQSIFVFVRFFHILRVSPTKSSKDTEQNNQRVYPKFGREPESNQNVLRKHRGTGSPSRVLKESRKSRRGGTKTRGRALEAPPRCQTSLLTNDSTKSTPVARRPANGRRRWSCAAKLSPSGVGRGLGGCSVFSLDRRSRLGLRVGGDVSVRGRLQAASW